LGLKIIYKGKKRETSQSPLISKIIVSQSPSLVILASKSPSPLEKDLG